MLPGGVRNQVRATSAALCGRCGGLEEAVTNLITAAEGVALNNLALDLVELGRYDDAFTFYTVADVILREVGDRHWEEG